MGNPIKFVGKHYPYSIWTSCPNYFVPREAGSRWTKTAALILTAQNFLALRATKNVPAGFCLDPQLRYSDLVFNPRHS